MVKSVTSGKPIKDIAFLHTGGAIDLDLTWGKGGLYKGTGIMPKFRFDLRKCGNMVVNLKDGIPILNQSVSSIVFDPPFLVRKKWRKSENWLFRHFCGYDSVAEAKQFFGTVIREGKRVLKKNGIMIIKIQDSTLSHGRTFWASHEIFQIAVENGLEPVDKFIEVAPVPKPLAPHIKEQRTARKVHCTWWVFKKSERRF